MEVMVIGIVTYHQISAINLTTAIDFISSKDVEKECVMHSE